MNPITQTIKEREDVLEEIIEKLAMAITHSEQGEYIKNEKFVREIIPTAHNTQSHIALLESVVGVVKKKEVPYKEDFKCGGCNNCEACFLATDDFVKGYNAALQSILTELQEALKELKDNEKEV